MGVIFSLSIIKLKYFVVFLLFSFMLFLKGTSHVLFVNARFSLSCFQSALSVELYKVLGMHLSRLFLVVYRNTVICRDVSGLCLTYKIHISRRVELKIIAFFLQFLFKYSIEVDNNIDFILQMKTVNC